MEVTPGSQTSEFKMAKYLFMFGVGLDIVGVIIHSLQGHGVSLPFFPAVLSVVGTLTAVLGSLGYMKSRTLVKAAQMSAKSDSSPS